MAETPCKLTINVSSAVTEKGSTLECSGYWEQCIEADIVMYLEPSHPLDVQKMALLAAISA
jgi:hypothetical protein